ncbi:unnamed protein product, partial [Mesorhabditis spiculigera]
MALRTIYGFGISRFVLAYYEQVGEFGKIYEDPPIPMLAGSLLFGTMIVMVPTIFFFVLIERIVATVNAPTYETCYYPQFFMALRFVGVIFALFISILYTFNFLSPGICAWIGLIATVITGVLALVITYINEKQNRLLYLLGYTLSHRYQLTENLKAMDVLLLVLSYVGVNNLIFGSLFLLNRRAQDPQMQNWVGIAISAHVAIYSVTMTFIYIFANRNVRTLSIKLVKQQIKETWPCSLRYRYMDVRDTTPSVFALDVRGQVLYTGANQEDYFQQLESHVTTVIEVLFLIITCLAYLPFFYVVCTCPIFHINLRRIIFVTVLHTFLTMVMRFIMMLYEFEVVTRTGDVIADLPLVWAGLAMLEQMAFLFWIFPMIIAERMFAMHFMWDYERNSRTWISTSILGVALVVSTIAALIMAICVLLIRDVFMYVGVPLCLGGIFGFALTYRWVARQNSITLANLEIGNSNYGLSAKYQASENIKSFKVSGPMSVP